MYYLSPSVSHNVLEVVLIVISLLVDYCRYSERLFCLLLLLVLWETVVSLLVDCCHPCKKLSFLSGILWWF
jgi:hypothetical protein